VAPDDGVPDDETESEDDDRRRLLILLVLLLLAMIGGGFGAFVLTDQPDGGGVTTPSGTPVPPAPNATGNVSLSMPEGATMLRAENVAPGDAGTSQLILRNEGEAPGALAISAASVESDENGVVSAESAVDDSPNEGELAEQIRVRLSVRYPDGDVVTVYGTDGFASLAEFRARNQTIGPGIGPGEEAVVVFDWRLPGGTTNVIQSDTARFDVVFALRSTNETDGE